MSTTLGLPSVSVPVLSTTSVSTFSSRSSASAFLTSTPSCAPRPTPTMIAMGVARPSAHGQAMISTATALTMAYASRGSGPTHIHATNVSAETASTTGTNKPATLSASPWMGARLRCASATMLTICASSVSLPDPLRAHHEAAGAVDGAAGHLVAGGLLHRERLAGDHGLVDAASVPRAPRRPPAPCRRDARAACRRPAPPRAGPPRRRDPTTRRAVGGSRSSSARMAPPVRARARSSSTWPSSTRTTIIAAASK